MAGHDQSLADPMVAAPGRGLPGGVPVDKQKVVLEGRRDAVAAV